MGSIENIRESISLYLIQWLSRGKKTQIDRELDKLEELEKSIEYRKADMLFLFQSGFNYDQKEDIFFKTEDIDYGSYPGEYYITIQFPDNYPKKPPIIKFKPKFKGKYSKHILLGYKVCVAKELDDMPNTYWKSNMNSRGALKLAYQVVTNELVKTNRKVRPKVSIVGTIFNDISKIITIKKFYNDFAKEINLDIDETYKWTEIAYKFAKLSNERKKELIKYYEKEMR